MANRLNENPIVIDTTAQAVPGPLTITALVWAGTQNSGKDIAADDDLLLRVGGITGQVIVEKRAATNGDGLTLTFAKPWTVAKGLYVGALDGGELHIFLA